MKNIRAYWGSSHEYGGCNACNRYVVNGHSQRKHRVLNIDFLQRALSFRLCLSCLEALKMEVNSSRVHTTGYEVQEKVIGIDD
jgi:hypothetical protein